MLRMNLNKLPFRDSAYWPTRVSCECCGGTGQDWEMTGEPMCYGCDSTGKVRSSCTITKRYRIKVKHLSHVA